MQRAVKALSAVEHTWRICAYMHILVLRKLQYFCRMEHSKNATLLNVYQCFKLSDEYMKLLSTYRCGSRDSVYHLKICVERHFAALAESRL